MNVTKRTVKGGPVTYTGMELGCMCNIDYRITFNGRVFPSYDHKVDWQNGFGVINIYPDGSSHIEPATFLIMY